MREGGEGEYWFGWGEGEETSTGVAERTPWKKPWKKWKLIHL